MKYIRTIRSYMKILKEDHVAAYAAEASYFIILSFIPFIMLMMSLIQFTVLEYTSLTRTDVIKAFMSAVPSVFQDVFLNILDDIYNRPNALVSLTAVTAIWSSARGILSISNGLNVIYGVKETRNYVFNRIRAALYTTIFLLAIILSLALLVFGNRIHILMVEYWPVVAKITKFLMNIRIVVTLLILTVLFLFMFRFLPNRKATFRSQLPGSFLTAAIWITFSYFFSIYVDNSSNIFNIYGSLTTVILVMLWLYFCMYIMLMGAVLNARYEEKIIYLKESA